MGNASDDAFKNAAGAGLVEGAESEGVEDGDRAGTHGEDVAENATDPGRGSLKGFYGGRVVVGFDLERETETLAEINNSSIFTGAYQDAIALGGKLFEEGAGIFVAAML